MGKDFFSKSIEQKLGIKSYSASELIKAYGNVDFASDKKTKNISGNQDYLLQAIKSKKLPKEYILNGHFCLINSKGKIERIEIETFYSLNPRKILILEEKPEIIVERRMMRDKEKVSVKQTKDFQEEEIRYGKEIAKVLNIPISIIKPIEEINKAISFITKT